LKKYAALLIVDVQNDFCPGGALPVSGGDEVVPILNRYVRIFGQAGLAVFASRDWHPVATEHFKDFGGTWPLHCVQHTHGARFHPALDLTPEVIVISKGMDPAGDSYSVFQGADEEGHAFLEVLRQKEIKQLFVGGLATDSCVKYSVRDARAEGFGVFLLGDAIRGVNLQPDDSQKAIEEMAARGARIIFFAEAEKILEASR